MLTVLFILILGVPAAVTLLAGIEDFLSRRIRPTRAQLTGRLQQMVGVGLLAEHPSQLEILTAAVRLAAWLTALAGILAEMLHVWSGADGIAIWLVFACGSLEIVRWFSHDVPGCAEPSRMLSTLVVWLSLLGAIAGAGCLFGTFDLAAISTVQARSGFWTAAVQPLGCGVFLVAAAALCISWRGRRRDVELIEQLTALVLALLFVELYCGGWHFWGISTYTTSNDVSFSAAVLRSLVVMVKLTAALCVVAWIRGKSRLRRRPDVYAVTEKLLLPMAAVNFMAALAAETWIAPRDVVTRSVLGWIAAVGAVTYGLMFHQLRMSAMREWWTARESEAGG